MKELSIEEKAKAYDEAIKRAKEINNEKKAQPFDVMLKIFPELKESEDEKSKKWILEYLYDGLRKSDEQFKEQFKCAIAWLEKQSTPQVRTGLEWVNTIDDACDKRYSEEYTHGEYCHEQSFKWGFQEGVAWLEKQDKTTDVEPVFSYKNLVTKKQSAKKPVDKVEPKFKVGDWVVFKNKHQSIYQVEKIEDGYYILRHTHGGTFRVCVLHDESLRLWTIQDAKPGDVLVNWNNTIYLFKGIDDGEVVKFYCFYNTNYEEFKTPFDDDSHLGLTEPQFEHHPAIKEQRELLFTKMKDAGYEFDFEKKELKKIEQNNTEEYIETKGLSELEAEAEELTKEISDEIEADKVVIKQGEHNSAWSEEDTETLNGIVNYLFTSTDVSSIEGSDKWYDWLKSLKNRVIPKQEWSEEDEQYLLVCKNALAKYQASDKWDAEIISCWLENKLKALQNTWKPSEEQMGVIEAVINNRSFQRRHLDSLYADLKKLRGK